MSNIIRNKGNNKNDGNNIRGSNNNTRTNSTQACAACKHQRKKCTSDCLLAPYFPHHLHCQFLNAHRLFGVNNITKIIRPLPQPQKDQAMRTIKLESDVRALDPVGGSCRIIRNLEAQIELACAEHELVLQQLIICRSAASADIVSPMCDPNPHPQPEVGGPETENVINNNVEDHESNEYKFVDEAISPDQQTQPESNAEDDDDVTFQCNSMINHNPEDQLYQHDVQHLDENTENDGVGIKEYFLEEDRVINDENNNVNLSLQDIEASWVVRDALAYCLHDKEGSVGEGENLRPCVVDIGGERLGLEYCNDEVGDI